MSRVRKRSLIVWISNLRDEDRSELSAAMKLMTRRHLVMLASLRETILDERLEDKVHDVEDATRIATIDHYLRGRRQAHRALETGYLDTKSAGLL